MTRRQICRIACLGVLVLCCRETEERTASHTPLVVVGIDGAEWSVIRSLWEQGRLPAFRSLADAGVTAELETAYLRSPVIWTTIATGVAPWVHGIEDFVMPGPDGDVPVSSAHRKVPALWNIVDAVGRRCAVLGWWASWPAEEIDGIVVTDRVLDPVAQRVWPPAFEQELARRIDTARKMKSSWATGGAELRDRLVALSAEELIAAGNLDLVLVYFRTLDVTSHRNWRYWQPERFPPVPRSELEAHAGEVPRAYEAVDEALGRILAAAAGRWNVIVVSDHGFHAAKAEEVRVFLDLDSVLERLGYLVRTGDGDIDISRSVLYTHATPEGTPRKKVRLGGGSSDGVVDVEAEMRRRLARDLTRVTYRSGRPVLAVRLPEPRERRDGADLMLDVLSDGAGLEVLVDGEPVAGAVSQISRISGTHTKTTHGIFLATGPDFDSAANLEGIRVQDLASTIAYGLGLPVAQDSVGRPRLDLYREEVRQHRPLRTIESWGTRQVGGVVPHAAGDAEVLRQLRALGYID